MTLHCFVGELLGLFKGGAGWRGPVQGGDVSSAGLLHYPSTEFPKPSITWNHSSNALLPENNIYKTPNRPKSRAAHRAREYTNIRSMVFLVYTSK
jgi:hypothetical protein